MCRGVWATQFVIYMSPEYMFDFIKVLRPLCFQEALVSTKLPKAQYKIILQGSVFQKAWQIGKFQSIYIW